MSRKEQPVLCPYCARPVARPQPFLASDEPSGGRCACGALFVADLTGKGGGQALLDGLTLLCEGDVERALGLVAGADYELDKLGYRPRTHSLEPRLPGRGAFGRPKLWFLRLILHES